MISLRSMVMRFSIVSCARAFAGTTVQHRNHGYLPHVTLYRQYTLFLLWSTERTVQTKAQSDISEVQSALSAFWYARDVSCLLTSLEVQELLAQHIDKHWHRPNPCDVRSRRPSDHTGVSEFLRWYDGLTAQPVQCVPISPYDQS